MKDKVVKLAWINRKKQKKESGQGGQDRQDNSMFPLLVNFPSLNSMNPEGGKLHL